MLEILTSAMAGAALAVTVINFMNLHYKFKAEFATHEHKLRLVEFDRLNGLDDV